MMQMIIRLCGERNEAPTNQDIVEDTYGQLVRAKNFQDVAKRAILSA